MKTDDKRSCFPDVIFFLLSLLAMSFQIAAVVFPGWWVVENRNEEEHFIDGSYYGIWVTYNCVNESCTSQLSDRSGKKAWLQGVAVMQTLSAVLLPFATASIGYVLFKKSKGSILRRLFVLISGGTGVVSIIGILVFIKQKAGLTSGVSLDTRHGTPGWPLGLAGCSAGLALILGVAMAVCIAVVFRRQTDPDEEEQRSAYWLEKDKRLQELK